MIDSVSFGWSVERYAFFMFSPHHKYHFWLAFPLVFSWSPRIVYLPGPALLTFSISYIRILFDILYDQRGTVFVVSLSPPVLPLINRELWTVVDANYRFIVFSSYFWSLFYTILIPVHSNRIRFQNSSMFFSTADIEHATQLQQSICIGNKNVRWSENDSSQLCISRIIHSPFNFDIKQIAD